MQVNKTLLFLSIVFLLFITLGCTVDQKNIQAPTTQTQNSTSYLSDKLYCEKDSDCISQPTKASKCCGNACPDIVNIHNYDDSEIDCGKIGCSDLFFVCPPFEIKCIDNQCQKINI